MVDVTSLLPHLLPHIAMLLLPGVFPGVDAPTNPRLALSCFGAGLTLSDLRMSKHRRAQCTGDTMKLLGWATRKDRGGG